MKKTLSLVLAFSMLLTLLLPMSALAEGENPNQELYDKVYNSPIGKALRDTSITSQQLIDLAKALEGKGYVNGLISETFTEINKNEELKTFLNGKYEIDEKAAQNLANIIINWGKAEENKGQIKSMAEKMEASSSVLKENELACIQRLRTKITTKFFSQISTINGILKDPNQKTDLASDLVKAVLNNVKVEEVDANKNLTFSIDKDGLNARIKEIENTYLKEECGEYKVTSLKKDRVYATIDALQPVLNTYYGKVEAEAISAGISKNLIISAIRIMIGDSNYKEYVAPNPPAPTPGTGGGGASSGGGSTTPATSTPSEVVVPEDPKAPVSATIGKEGTTVTTKDGVANVSVDEGKALATVEALAKKADGREVVLVVKPEGVKGMNANVSLPGSVVLALKDKKVNLQIVAGKVEYSIPYDAIDTSNIEKGAKVEFKSQEIKEEAPVELAAGLGEVKNTIELFLEITKGGKTTKVTKFNKTIEVRINIAGFKNHDKLAAYYLDEEDNTLEFVGGYIKNNRIVLKLNHFSKYVLIESTKTFPDIAKHWSKDYVESMIAKNIVDGYSDGTFKPEGKITRAEFVKMVVCALNEDLVEYNGGFKDVKANDWHADYIATAKALGLIDGYADGSFRPNATIKRAEMAAILGKVVDVEIDEKDIDKASSLFTDFADIEEWAKESVAKVSKAGLMNGADGKFNANKDTTRAEAATTLYRLYIR